MMIMDGTADMGRSPRRNLCAAVHWPGLAPSAVELTGRLTVQHLLERSCRLVGMTTTARATGTSRWTLRRLVQRFLRVT